MREGSMMTNDDKKLEEMESTFQGSDHKKVTKIKSMKTKEKYYIW